jgi:restriction system protein
MAHYQTITSDKNKDTALLLCIFGGWLGLHQFYVGKIGKGLLYMITCGFFFIGWGLDIIKILLGTFRDNTGAPLRATKAQNNTPTEVKVVNQEIKHTNINIEDNITQIERLSKLKEQGVITEEEFNNKKQELLK